MNLSKLLIIFLISFCSVTGAQETPPSSDEYPSVLIETNLTVEAEVEYKRRTKYFHNIHCSKRGNKTRGDGDVLVSISNEEVYEGEADIIIDLNHRHRYKTRHPRTLTIKIESHENEDGSTSVVGGVADVIDWKFSQKKFQSQKCKELYTKGKVENTDINGQLRIGFRVPDNVWLLQVERGEGTGAFDSRFQMGTSDAIQASDPIGIFQYVWTEPNSVIYEVFDYNTRPDGNGVGRNPSQNMDLDGVMNIRFIPLGDALSDDYSPTDSLVEVLSKTQDKLWKEDALSKSDTEKILNDLALTLRNPERLYDELRKISLDDRFGLSEKYFLLSAQILPTTEAGLIQDLSATVSLVAFEIALSYLIDTQPFCANVEWQNGLVSDPIQVLGYSFYQHFMHHAKTTLETYSFEDFNFFLEKLEVLASEGHTYLTAQTNDRLRSDLNDSFFILQDRIGALPLPIENARRNLAVIRGKMGAPNTLRQFEDTLITQINESLSVEEEFKSEFQRLLRRFQRYEESRIDVSELKKLIVELEGRRALLAGEFGSLLSLLTISGSFDAPTNFLVSLYETLVDSGSVAPDPSSTSDGDDLDLSISYFTPIGDRYFHFKNGPSVIDQAERCIYNE